MGLGPARTINFSENGPRPGPAHHIKKKNRSGPARPGPSFFQRLGPARPGPSRGSEAYETRALYGPARQLRGPARGFDGPAHEPAHVLFRTKACMYTLRCCEFITSVVVFSLFFPVWIPWDSCFRPRRHITSTYYSHNPAPPTTRSDGFLWATTSSCCCNARSSSRNSSSTCCYNTRCCCQGKNIMLPASPRRQGVSSVHPQRYQGFDPTFTQDKTS